MVLAIDIGNTNVKLGLYDDEDLVCSYRFASAPPKTADEYGRTVCNALTAEGHAPDTVSGIVLSSVIPSLNYTFDHMCRYYFGIAPLFVTAALDTGLTIAYDNPSELGADRIATAAGAFAKYGGRRPLAIVDFGTATTFNFVTAGGVFRGGAIFAGMRAASESPASSTAKLPRFEIVAPRTVVGTNTVDNLQAGLFYGFLGAVEKIVLLAAREPGLADPFVVATGGFGALLEPHTDLFDTVDRRLSLDGLNLLYRRNAAAKERG